jgi:hypothetical protein
MTEISYFRRLEPRARENDFTRNLAAELRDPLWLLARQWQVGEFKGQDAGSLCYVSYSGGVSQLPRWQHGTSVEELSADAPLEPQTLREPFDADLSVQVELGQDLSEFLFDALNDVTQVTSIVDAFRAMPEYLIQLPTDSELAPIDPSTKRFLLVCSESAVNGYALYRLGQRIASGSDTVPSTVTTDPTQRAAIEAVLARLVQRVTDVYGELSTTADPVTWAPDHLEYELSVVAADPSGIGNATLSAYPDSDGEFEWFSFDVSEKAPSASETAFEPRKFVTIPARVEFPGMPSSRFWTFEENSLSLPDVKSRKVDLLKLLSIDFLLIHSHDWYRIPYMQQPGTVARTDYLMVRDVFGRNTVVYGANSPATGNATERWSLFNPKDDRPETNPGANYFILPPSAGAAMTLGAALEDVRFGRDEMANMAWAIERVTTSPIGEARSGRERDAEIDARRHPPAPAPPGAGSDLRYSVESEVPANFVPLLPKLAQPATTDPSILLRRGQALKATTNDGILPVPVLSRILNPEAQSPYDIQEEEVPRSGLRVERVVYRTRWIDGSVHLWVQRRRRIGSGEAQSGLKFDQAIANPSGS